MMWESLRNERGQGIVEYAFILAVVVVISYALVNSGDVKTSIGEVFASVARILGVDV